MAADNGPVAVVGAGPAGLCAAIELKKAGAPVVLFDEIEKPGGQQIGRASCREGV